MPRFSVTWYVEVTAETAEEAAQKASEEERHTLYTCNLTTGETKTIFSIPFECGEE
jgi:hypothetical protein